MQFLRYRAFRVSITLVVLVAAPFLWSFGEDWYWRTHPDAAFKSITGRSLPPGVHAVAYIGHMNDALFHTTHYWRLTGSISDLRQVIAGTGFVPVEDARVFVTHIANQFGLDRSASQVAAAFEWDEIRAKYYCILEGGAEAFYLH